MGQKATSPHLSPYTIQLLEELFIIERRYPSGYAPVEELRPLLTQKHFYVDGHQNYGGRETNRTFLRLFSESSPDSIGGHPDKQCLNIQDVRDVFIKLDEFYGLGLRTLRNLLQFSDIASCVSEIRARPYGESEGLFPNRQEPMLQHYVFDPESERSLVVEVTRRSLGVTFGMFLFHAERITGDGEKDFLEYCIKDLARIFRRPDHPSYRVALKDSIPITPHESAPMEYSYLKGIASSV